MGMVVYTMSEMNTLDVDLDSFLESEDGENRATGHRISTLDEARGVAEKIRARIRYDVMGRDDVIELVLVSLFSGGHVLLEDYPGSGKTTLAKALGESILSDKPDVEAILLCERNIRQHRS